jgi:hypothetical protein
LGDKDPIIAPAPAAIGQFEEGPAVPPDEEGESEDPRVPIRRTKVTPDLVAQMRAAYDAAPDDKKVEQPLVVATSRGLAQSLAKGEEDHQRESCTSSAGSGPRSRGSGRRRRSPGRWS